MRLQCALGVLLLSLTGASAASAQGLNCVLNAAVPPVTRSEGLAELNGDLVLQCIGTAPGAFLNNVTVLTSTNVTSRVLGSASEVLLLIDEPAAGNQTLGVNVFQGVVSANTVSFLGIPFATAAGPVNRVLRITNLRTNGVAGNPGTVVATVTSTGAVSVTIANSIVTTAFSQSGVTFDSQCAVSGQSSVNLRFTEAFPTSFKARGGASQSTPGLVYNSESGFTPSPFISGVGLADTGTQLGVALSGIPAGVQLVVPALVTSAGLTITALSPFGGGVVPVAGGAATITYEVVTHNPLLQESISIPVTMSQLPLVGALARGNLYPISTQTTASASAPIPRFSDVSTAMPFAVACISVPTLSSTAFMVLALGLLGLGGVMAKRGTVR